MLPVRVGLVGTGYAAKLRAETLQADSRSHLVAVVGHHPDQAAAFGATFNARVFDSWTALVEQPDLDLVIVATINRDHGTIARAALEAGKHVVVEYPLSLDVAEAEDLIALAKVQNKMLHIEHIELLSGIHQAIVSALPAIGTPFYSRYASINPQRPAPQKWTYQPDLFGFPLVGAVSRIHRMTALFGEVVTVSCEARFWSRSGLPDSYHSCLCTAQLRFASGLIASVVYGKGESLWQAERSLVIQGEQGAILMDGEQGTLVQAEGSRSLDTGSRRGLFAKDTSAVLDHLITNSPLYVSLHSSLYALKVADAARRSAEKGQTVYLT